MSAIAISDASSAYSVESAPASPPISSRTAVIARSVLARFDHLVLDAVEDRVDLPAQGGRANDQGDRDQRGQQRVLGRVRTLLLNCESFDCVQHHGHS